MPTMKQRCFVAAVALFPAVALIVTELLLSSSAAAFFGLVAAWAAHVSVFPQVNFETVARIVATAAFVAVVSTIDSVTVVRRRSEIVLKIACVVDAGIVVACLLWPGLAEH